MKKFAPLLVVLVIIVLFYFVIVKPMLPNKNRDCENCWQRAVQFEGAGDPVAAQTQRDYCISINCEQLGV